MINQAIKESKLGDHDAKVWIANKDFSLHGFDNICLLAGVSATKVRELLRTGHGLEERSIHWKNNLISWTYSLPME